VVVNYGITICSSSPTSKLDEIRKIGRYSARGNEGDKGAEGDNEHEPDDEAACSNGSGGELREDEQPRG
jgi:hypothetical protein